MAVPSEAHMLAFGHVIHHFAGVETGIKLALSGILELHVGDAMVVFEPYGAVDLKNVAKSIGKQRLKPQWAEKFCCIVGDWAAYNGLRNIIAHSRWTEGDRPGSIKPRRLSIREGRAQLFGDNGEEVSYTAAELEAHALKLHLINERSKRFLQESGLLQIIEAKIAETSSDTSESSGSEGKQSDK